MVEGTRAVVTAERLLSFERFELPEPQGSQVLVRLERTIISAGTELANYTGLEPDTRVPGSWCCYPWNPGYGGIGRVIATGAEVTHLPLGDRVYGIFNHATHGLVDSAREICVRVPGGLDSTTAVFVRMGNVAITAWQRATVAPGDEVMVIGLGIVGNLAGQFFALAGARVTGVDLSERRRVIALETGFAAAVGPEAMTGLRPRIVVDAVGDSRVIETAVSVVRRNGQVILLGTPRAPYPTDATEILRPVHQKGVNVIGALEWNIPLLKGRADGGLSTEGNAELVLGMLARGELLTGSLCTHVLPGDRLGDGYRGLLEEKDTYLGVVLDWDQVRVAG